MKSNLTVTLSTAEVRRAIIDYACVRNNVAGVLLSGKQIVQLEGSIDDKGDGDYHVEATVIFDASA